MLFYAASGIVFTQGETYEILSYHLETRRGGGTLGSGTIPL